MKTLFLDTHSELLTVAILNENKLNKKEIESFNSHSVILLPLIETLLKEENIKVEDIDNIVVVNGPGSFTGIRIGLTVAKTMGYAKNIKVFPISSLEAYLISSDIKENKMAVIEDTKGYYISASDLDNNIILEEQYVSELDDYDFKIVEGKLNIPRIVNYLKEKESINVNAIKANYIKKISVEL